MNGLPQIRPQNTQTRIIRNAKGCFMKGTVTNGNKTKKSGGRPTVMTPIILERLRAAYRLDATDLLACNYAEISTTALYDYQKMHPEFTEQKYRWKQEPILRALKSVADSLSTNVGMAWKYLEKKMPEEFGKSGGKVNQPLLGAPKNEEQKQLMQEMLKNHYDYIRQKESQELTQGS